MRTRENERARERTQSCSSERDAPEGWGKRGSRQVERELNSTRQQTLRIATVEFVVSTLSHDQLPIQNGGDRDWRLAIGVRGE